MGKQNPLRLLAETILTAITSIESQFGAAGLEFPSLNDSFDPTHPTTGLLFHPDVVANTAIVSAAAGQLLATVRPPQVTMMETTISVRSFAFLGWVGY
jgi:hypothetical protein